MCAQFQVEQIKFRKSLAIFSLELGNIHWRERILPHLKSPVIISKNKRFTLELFNFSLIPSWSKVKKPKFSTHNVRIETVLTKPTWKKPFLLNHCLVPITDFIEPIYEGKYAGNMIKFSFSECIFVPAIYDEWLDPTTGEVIESFSILTTTPGSFIEEIGHDRSPIFLPQKIEYFTNWLSIGNRDNKYFIKLLNSHVEPPMMISIDRKLKKKG
ncbi:SOS response-associated peptidase family protein [Pigmentibacter ruber]